MEISFKNYKDLKVWNKSMAMVKMLYLLVRKLPKEESYALSDQMRRAAVSIPSNIAEGQGRHTQKEFNQFLSMAKGSVFELETQLIICVQINYLTEEDIQPILSLLSEIGKMLNALQRHLTSNF